MFSFDRSFLRAKTRAGSNIALAIALATGAAVGVAGFAVPAHAAKKDKEKPGKANYSKAFVEAYQPVADKLNAEGADAAALLGEVRALASVAETDDDKFATGQLIYNAGAKSKNSAAQREGMELMLASGKVEPARLGAYNFVASQLAYNDKDYPVARERALKAMELGYTENDPEVLIAETYINEGQIAQGLDYLDRAIAARGAAGAEVPVNWAKRGLTVAYQNSMPEYSRKYSTWLVTNDSGNKDNWGDAIAIERTIVDYDDQAVLDLLRLARKVGGLRGQRDYVDYIAAADSRRLPGEVNAVVSEGIAAGLLATSDVFVAEAKSVSSSRIAADKADIPALEADARKSNATAVTASAAGDVFLSYDNGAKAAEMYEIALTKAGVDTARVLTRLGIAQVEAGMYDEALATFAKVQGQRAPIATLWSLYAKQEAGSDMAASM